MESTSILFSENLIEFKNKLTQNWFINNTNQVAFKQRENSINILTSKFNLFFNYKRYLKIIFVLQYKSFKRKKLFQTETKQK